MIICGFPGVGKTYSAERWHNGVDLESSKYHWCYYGFSTANGRRYVNPAWPHNYIDAATSLLREGKTVFMSSHQEVVDELAVRDLFYWLVIPHVTSREEYRQRYIKRGSPESFTNRIVSNWCAMLRSCHTQLGGAVCVLKPNESLNDVLSDILQ